MTDPRASAPSDTAGLKRAGALLRKTRMQQGFTIEEIAQATRIQRSHLDAIERGDSAALPSGPFAKGFVTSYGRHLGVPMAELEALLSRPAVEEPKEDAAEGEGGDAEGVEARGPARRRVAPALAIGAVVVAAVAVGLALRPEPPPPESAPAAPLAVEAAPEGGPRAESERIVRAASVEGEDGQSYIVFTDLEREGAPHAVAIEAVHRSYVQVAASLGGEPLYEAILEPGKAETFTSDTELWVVLGNAGGVKVKYDGEPLKELGLDGDRRGFAFRGP